MEEIASKGCGKSKNNEKTQEKELGCAVIRNMLPGPLKRKQVSAQAYPRESPRVLIHTCAGGWVAGITRASKLKFFFVPVPIRQVKVVFLRTLRNAATRL